jgi:hypothetical protein
MMKMRFLQKCLFALGVLALVFLLVEIGASLVATQHGSTPARVDQITAGPYRFTVSLYDYPAQAGFALPFTVAPQGATSGTWTYHVTSMPQGSQQENGRIIMSGNRVATPIKDSVSPDPQVPGGVQGDAEMSVQGQWNLQVVVDGPFGQQTFDVSVTATTLPAIPLWSGWAIGFLPVCGIVIFLLILVGSKRQSGQGALQMG